MTKNHESKSSDVGKIRSGRGRLHSAGDSEKTVSSFQEKQDMAKANGDEAVLPKLFDTEEAAREGQSEKQKVYRVSIGKDSKFVPVSNRKDAVLAFFTHCGGSAEPCRKAKGAMKKVGFARQSLVDQINKWKDNPSPIAQEIVADATAALKRMDDEAMAASAKRDAKNSAKGEPNGNFAPTAPAAAAPTPAPMPVAPAPAPAPAPMPAPVAVG